MSIGFRNFINLANYASVKLCIPTNRIVKMRRSGLPFSDSILNLFKLAYFVQKTIK